MKQIIVTILGLFISLFCLSRNMTNKEDTILILTEGKFLRIELSLPDILDSLKIGFSVIVDFEHPLKDTTQEINIQKFELLSMRVENLKTNEVNRLYEDSNMSCFQKYIWSLCYNKLNYWYSKQNYENMIGRQEWGERVKLGGVLYLIPEKNISK
ncbi:MAG: hypothetical protein RR212_06175 [Bacteroidales bacterium]